MLLSGPARKKRPQASRKIRAEESISTCSARRTRGGRGPEQRRTRGGGSADGQRTRAPAAAPREAGPRGSAAATSPGGAGERVRAGEVWLPVLPLLSRSLVGPFLPRAPLSALYFSRASLCAHQFLPRAHSFPRPFFRDFLPPRNGPLYGARHARLGANRTPNRRLPDAMVVRRTPYQSEASRPPSRPAYSALPIRRRQSDALKTLSIRLF